MGYKCYGEEPPGICEVNLAWFRDSNAKGSMYMFKYTLQRILYMCMVLLIITAMCFVLVRMLPPAALPPGDPHTAVVEARREALGYNKPYMVQFGIFLQNVFTKFDWGISDKLYFGQSVTKIFFEKLPVSIIVNLYSILLSIPIGIGLGIFAIPGVGGLTINAINAQDYPIFMLTTCFYTAIGLVASLVVDISYGFIDPRIRMGSKK